MPTDDWWAALGDDVALEMDSDLQELEARLAASTRDALTRLYASPALRDGDTASLFVSYLEVCTRKAGAKGGALAAEQTENRLEVFDRDAEIRSVHSFLDDSGLFVLEVTGLPQIGKTALIRKAIAQSGLAGVVSIPTTGSSTPDYLVYSLIKRAGGSVEPPYADPVAVLDSIPMHSVVDERPLLIIEDAHNLVERGAWRDENWGRLLVALVALLAKHRGKLIIESRRELPLELDDPSLRKPLRIAGLDRGLLDFGVSLFDAQLRRVGLTPGSVDLNQKRVIVSKLGGHPIAIALAADASFEEGVEAVTAALKEKKGFYLNFLSRLLRGLSLSEEDRTVLSLLCLARAPLPRDAVLSGASFPAGPALRNLLALGAVEVTPEGLVEIASVLREFFDPRDVAPEQARGFHAAAAKAFSERYVTYPNLVSAAVEAEFHASMAGVKLTTSSKLPDGLLATARELYAEQRYKEAADIIQALLAKRRSLELIRLAAVTEARLSHFASALAYAKQVFGTNPRDSSLLAELSKIALTQYQTDELADELIAIAQKAGIEDVTLLIVEERKWLRVGDFPRAEEVLKRACELTDKNPWPYYHLGRVYLRSGRIDQAIETLEEGQEFFYETNGRSRAALNAIRSELAQAYLYANRLDLAEPIVESLFDEDPTRPEVARVYAALRLKRDGVRAAHKAYERLSQAKIRSRFDRCQFHLFYGQFFLAIGDRNRAAEEFRQAHDADRSNVYVMMRRAKTLFEIAVERWMETDDSYKLYVDDCTVLVRKILEFDPDNPEGVELLQALQSKFGATV